MRVRHAAAVGLAVAALAASPAGAATPFTAGEGTQASQVAVGADGTGHVVWVTDETADRVGYCRVPAGGSACDRTELLPFPAAGNAVANSGSAQVFAPRPGTVIVFASCHRCGPNDFADQTYRWTSTTNGQSFGPHDYLGEGDIEGQATLLPGDGLLAAARENVRATPADPGDVNATTFSQSYDHDVAPTPDGRYVTASNDLNDIRFARYSGPLPPTNAQLNTQANWGTNQSALDVQERGSDSSLAGGPSGLFMLYSSTVNLNERLFLRRYEPAAGNFGVSGVPVPSEAEIDTLQKHPDSFQDAAGRLHVVWNASHHDGGRLRYVRSDDGGATFGAIGSLASKESFLHPTVAAGPDGKGFATWAQSGFPPVAIRVVALDPQPEPIVIIEPPPPPLPPPVITSGPAALIPEGTATFAFSHPESGVTFECPFSSAFNAGDFKDCTSPISYRVSEGNYTFWVRARASDGRRSALATHSFKVDVDSDGDRLLDSVDRCPAFASSRPDGCPPSSAAAVASFTKALKRLLGRTRIKALLARGRLSLPLSPPAAGKLTVTVKLGVGAGTTSTTVLSAKRTFTVARRAQVPLKLTRAGARAIRRASRARLRVRVSYQDVAKRSFTGNATATMRK